MPPNSNYTQPGTMPPPTQQMPSSSQPLPGGSSSTKWVITIIVLTVLLLGTGGFAVWAFEGRQDYKNNADAKIAAAVQQAQKDTTDKNNKAFAEQLKSPVKTWVGPSAYGSVTVQYPKTYSGYIATSDTDTTAVDASFHPDTVPAITAANSSNPPAVALRIQVLNQAYDLVLQQHQSAVSIGDQTAAPFALEKMPKQIGTKFVGKLQDQLKGTQIVLPLRDKTLVITTDTDQYLGDFNKYVLPNLTFEP